MTVRIRIIGSPDEVAEAEELIRGCFIVHGARHYHSKRSTDRLAYLTASARARSGIRTALEVPDDISNLDIRLRDQAGVNAVFLCYRFETDEYISHSVAQSLNAAIQSDLREIVDEDLEGVDGRLDQTFKRPAGSVIAYRSGNGDWLAFPCDKGGIE